MMDLLQSVIKLSKHNMKANFEIALPSIPGKSIKFKIQDMKLAAFGTQKSRFPQNKSLLTKKFVQSFNNFHQTKRDDEIETQAQSEHNKSRVSQKRQLQFRQIISENKKFLLPLYTQLQIQEKEKIGNSLIENEYSTGGYSFPRAGLKEKNNQQENVLTNFRSQRSEFTDNYYFTKDESRGDKAEERLKKPRPSAVFKNETRKKVEDRIYNSVVPGPGAYLKERPVSHKKKAKKSQSLIQNSLSDYKHLKSVIGKILQSEKQQVQQPQEEDKKEVKPNYMFVQDDRDRFGSQIFPVAPKLKIPGPGHYQISDTLEDRVKKLVLVEEQRKLLKQWFNN